MVDRRKDERKAALEMALFIKNQNDLNKKIELALFGNENENGVVKDVKRMVAVFDSVGGFNKISVLILKGIIMLSASLTAGYYILHLIRGK